MPELPEVETVVRQLRAPLVGRTITTMWYDWPRVIHSPTPEMFAARIAGQTVQAINRRAKYILIELDHDIMVIHLKMTGRLYVADTSSIYDADRWVHFRLDLENSQQLRFSDPRKFGRVYLTGDLMTITRGLGPEPLADDFTPAIFYERLHKRRKNLKALLLDQSFIAGVGNIYADEALFHAGLHPLRRSDSLSETESTRLYHAVRQVLEAGISHEGASISWYRKPDGTRGSSQNHFYVYGLEGSPCRHCGTPVAKIRVAQRGTHYCPTCQFVSPGGV